MIDIVALLVVERSDLGFCQQLGKADNIGQGRAQSIGDMFDKCGFNSICRF